jgi:hypothetical protein
MTPAEILKEARKIIARPEAWTKGATARDVNGMGCYTDTAEAVCFCSMGAILRVRNSMAKGYCPAKEDRAFRILSQTVRRPTAAWNDDPATTHADVLNAFDHAIAKAEGGENE